MRHRCCRQNDILAEDLVEFLPRPHGEGAFDPLGVGIFRGMDAAGRIPHISG